MSTDEKIADSPSGDNTPPPERSADVEHEHINEKALLRKLDAQLLPAVGILYLLSFLDRSNGRIGTPNTPDKEILTRDSWQCSHRGSAGGCQHECVHPLF